MNDVRSTRMLEIGSFEGRSSVFFLEEALKYPPHIEMVCIDRWQGVPVIWIILM